MKILMVCLGNICRSPLGEGILKKKIDEVGLDWQVDSAGTGAWHIGNPPDERSVDTARKNNIDISDIRARKCTRRDLIEYDLILAMDQENYDQLVQMVGHGNEIDKIKLLLDYLKPGERLSVPDPYWGGIEGFNRVFKLIEEACSALIDAHAPAEDNQRG